MRMRRRSGWPMKRTPYRSKASRSNQSAPAHRDVRVSTVGSSSGTPAYSRIRCFLSNERRNTTTSKRGSRPKRSTQVRSMNMSSLVTGSSRRKPATTAQASGRIRAHSFPCCDPVSRISPPRKFSFSRSRMICAMGRLLAGLVLGHANVDHRVLIVLPGGQGADGGDGHVVALLGLQRDLAVPLAALDPVLQHHQRVEHLFGPGGATGDVDVHGDDLIAPRHGGVVLIEAAGRGAHPEGDD